MGESNQSAHSNTATPGVAIRPAHVFAACIVVMLSTYLSPSLIRLLGPQLRAELAATESQWAALTSFRSLLLIVFVLASGVVGDLLGRRRVLLWVLIANIGANGLRALTANLDLLLAAGSLNAALNAMIYPLNVTILMLAFTGRARVYAIIWFSVLAGASYLFAPLVAEWLNTALATRAVFFLPVVLGLLGLGAVSKYMPESRSSPQTRRADVIALAVWAAGICALIFGMVQAGSLGWGHSLVLGTLGVGTLILISLMGLEPWLAGSRFSFKLYYSRQLSVAIIAGVVIFLALYAISYQIYRFLAEVQHYGWTLAGLALAPLLVGIVFLGTLVARLTVKLNLRQNLAFGLVILAGAALGLSLLQPNIPYWGLAVLLALVGLGFIVGNTPRLLLLGKAVPLDLLATVQSIGNATALVGGALAYALMVTLIEAFSQSSYASQLRAAGLSLVEIGQRLAGLAAAQRAATTILSPEGQLAALEQAAPGYQVAYTVGLSQAFLVLAGLCLVCAAVVWLGLREDHD